MQTDLLTARLNMVNFTNPSTAVGSTEDGVLTGLIGAARCVGRVS